MITVNSPTKHQPNNPPLKLNLNSFSKHDAKNKKCNYAGHLEDFLKSDRLYAAAFLALRINKFRNAPRNSNFHLASSKTSVFIRSRCGEMADAQDLKSWDLKTSCGFESRHRHHFINSQ
jgi:hypothetical protein